MLKHLLFLIFLYFLILYILILSCGYKEKYTHNEHPSGKTIFVSIASYRDKLCVSTLDDLFRKAKYPGSIYIGLCQQNDLDDEYCDNSLADVIEIEAVSSPHATLFETRCFV